MFKTMLIPTSCVWIGVGVSCGILTIFPSTDILLSRLVGRFSSFFTQPTLDLPRLEVEKMLLDITCHRSSQPMLHFCFIVQQQYFSFRRENVRSFAKLESL